MLIEAAMDFTAIIWREARPDFFMISLVRSDLPMQDTAQVVKERRKI